MLPPPHEEKEKVSYTSPSARAPQLGPFELACYVKDLLKFIHVSPFQLCIQGLGAANV